ncbi:MAG: RIP metalloprotease RseP [Planctomycetes bacterium]|nr:RIP metalloprotease RseP [Planctomycetota bacterium]
MNDLERKLAMVLGIGLVIFVHELGHFLAARLCKVRVDVFSLGFGPRLLAWRRGSTVYQLALLPLGGYVRMAGEDNLDGRAPAPDELQSKSVGQRFLIYAGGVLMNVVFALVVFPIVLAVGVPMVEPVIGSTEPGMPAWTADVEPGSRVLAVNGHAVIGFDNITPEVALGPSDGAELRLLAPGAKEPHTVVVPPVYDKGLGINVIGIRPPEDRGREIQVTEGSPAWKSGLRDGDRIDSVEGAPPGLSLSEEVRFASRFYGPISLHYTRKTAAAADQTGVARIEPTPIPGKGRSILGLAPTSNRIAALRTNADAQALGLQQGDVFFSVDGTLIRTESDLLYALDAPHDSTHIVVGRGGKPLELQGPALDAARGLALFRDIDLGLDPASARIQVIPKGAAAEAGIQTGDEIVSVDGKPIARFEDITPVLEQAGSSKALAVVVRRAGAEGEAAQELEFSVQPAMLPGADYGIDFQAANYTYQAPSPAEALRMGVLSSWRLMADSWLTLKRIMTGQVSGDNVGGIITIGHVSYTWAGQGLSKLFYFLCMLSVSLAFLNVLPIPVLDGGHLFFLLIEKIKGSPVSERVLSYSQMVGLVLLVSLVVYVTFNDIQRWYFK